MDLISTFEKQVSENIERLGVNTDAQTLSRVWSRESNHNGYTYNFSWEGHPVIQYNQDIVVMLERTY